MADNATFQDASSHDDTTTLGTNALATVFSGTVFVIAAVGVAGNAIFIAAIWKERQLRTISNYFIAHLCVVDILNCLMILPILLRSHHTRISAYACFASVIVRPFLPIMSMYSQLLVAVNRFYLVTKSPVDYKLMYTTLRNTTSVVTGWVFHGALVIILLVTIPPLASSERHDCANSDVFYRYTVLAGGKLLAFSALYFCCSAVFYHKLNRFVRCNALRLTASNRKDTRLASTLLRIAVLSFVSVLAMPVVFLLSRQLVWLRSSLAMTILSNAAVLISSSSYAVNPLLYCYRIELFRHTIQKMFPTFWRSRVVPTQSSD